MVPKVWKTEGFSITHTLGTNLGNQVGWFAFFKFFFRIIFWVVLRNTGFVFFYLVFFQCSQHRPRLGLPVSKLAEFVEVEEFFVAALLLEEQIIILGDL